MDYILAISFVYLVVVLYYFQHSSVKTFRETALAHALEPPFFVTGNGRARHANVNVSEGAFFSTVCIFC
jgi:hypothetical protein